MINILHICFCSHVPLGTLSSIRSSLPPSPILKAAIKVSNASYSFLLSPHTSILSSAMPDMYNLPAALDLSRLLIFHSVLGCITAVSFGAPSYNLPIALFGLFVSFASSQSTHFVHFNADNGLSIVIAALRRVLFLQFRIRALTHSLTRSSTRTAMKV